MKAISLFSSSGIGELYLKSIGVDIIAANELLEKRADCYKYFYPDVNMIYGDIRERKVIDSVKNYLSLKPKLLIVTPPCQGLSTLGKNKKQDQYKLDKRNYVIFPTFEIIDEGDFNYILIENVPRYLEMLFPYNKKLLRLEEILNHKYGSKYKIDTGIFDTKDYGIAQSRPRAIIRMYKKHLSWNDPKKIAPITLEKAIGHLPSLEPGEKSDIPWHYAKKENPRYIKSLRYTPTGSSALKNIKHYPKKSDGVRIKGFHNTFKRMKWDTPAHARTTYSYSMSSHNNVHPGRSIGRGKYSDARALTLLETFIVSSIPKKITFPEWASNIFIYTNVGEAIPPKLLKTIIEPIMK